MKRRTLDNTIVYGVFLINALLAGAAHADDQHFVPPEIQSFVGAGDTLLAYDTLEVPIDDGAFSVIILRHKLPSGAFNFEKNPCDLMILKKVNNNVSLQAKNNQIVDCTYDNFAKSMAKSPNDLNGSLKFNKKELSYKNEKDKGGDAYSFRFSSEKKEWYLYSADSVYTRDNEKTNQVDVVQSDVRYPKDIGYISFSKFSPDKLTKALEKNSFIVE